jgi:hypothetical protein
MTQRTDGQNAQIERHTRARKPERGIFEKVPCSGVWWIRYADATGRIRREKAGTWSAADKLYRKRKTEVLEGRKLPETLRRLRVSFAEIAQDTLDYSKAHKVREAYRIDRCHMGTLLAWFRERVAEEITPQQIECKLNDLAEEGHKPATIN